MLLTADSLLFKIVVHVLINKICIQFYMRVIHEENGCTLDLDVNLAVILAHKEGENFIDILCTYKEHHATLAI